METIKIYIFYTREGFAEDNQSKPTENCQILGWSKGKTSQEAFKNLVKENRYLEEMDFDEVMCQELVNEKVYYFSLGG